MIRTKYGDTKIEIANVHEMMADYACITRSVVDVLQKNEMSEEEAWKEIEDTIEMAKMPEDELGDRAKKGIIKLLAKMFSELAEESEEAEGEEECSNITK